jgi:mRNA-degrading endonuclease toxin of MazEF toxin-antitoxin module
MGSKGHMWVVISSDVFNGTNSYVMGCPLTSYPPAPIDVAVQKTPHNCLAHDSALRVGMMTPIDKADLQHAPLGRVPFSVVVQVTDRLRMIVEAREPPGV